MSYGRGCPPGIESEALKIYLISKMFQLAPLWPKIAVFSVHVWKSQPFLSMNSGFLAKIMDFLTLAEASCYSGRFTMSGIIWPSKQGITAK